MSLTNYGENRILELFKGAGTYYLALFTVSPSESGDGTEISAGGYARQKVTFGSAAGGAMSNSAAIEFPTATADWGTANGLALFDAVTGGNMLWYGAITNPKILYAGDIYRINIGNLTLTMD